MPEIKELGTVIASRATDFIFDDGRKKKAYLKVGMPFEYNENLDWCCPLRIKHRVQQEVVRNDDEDPKK